MFALSSLSKIGFSCTFLLMIANTTFASSTIIENVTTLKSVQAQINQVVDAKSNKLAAGDVLVVFDIDDTLLVSNNFIGGDSWYNWQRGREMQSAQGEPIEIKPDNKMSCLFSKLGLLYAMGTYHATETHAAEIVAELQNKYDLIALTSRSPNYRGGTQRELENAGFALNKSHLLPKSNSLSYQFNDGKSTRGISYQDGIVMSTGLHKGYVLKDLLMRLGKKYKAIFFVDDSRKNVDNMANAWIDDTTQVDIFHYTGVDKNISKQDIDRAIKAQNALDDFLTAAFPMLANDLSKGECQ